MKARTRGEHRSLDVLEVTQRYPPALGGVERHVEQLSAGLRASGQRVEVATTDLLRDRPFARLGRSRSPGGVPTVDRSRAYPLLPLPHGIGIVSPGLLRRVLAARPQVIHAHAFGYPPTWFGALSRGLHQGALVITPHADEGRNTAVSRAYAQLVARTTLTRADRVIALTRRESELLSRWGVTPDRIDVVPNGIDPSEFDPARHSRPTGSFRLLFVGRIYPRQKGTDVLVDAIGRLPRSASIRLRCVGEDWGGVAPARDLAARSGVLDRIEFTGAMSRTDLLEEYRSADLLVVPSRFEPFGIVLLEAMASGVPIVASRVGGIPEVVEDGRSALLVEPGDPVALAGAIDRLRCDDALREGLVARGRERVRDFAWPALVPRILKVFATARE